MFQMLGVYAEFERPMIVDGVNSGLARARAKGATINCPQHPVNNEGLFHCAQICPALIWCKCLVRLYERMGFALIFKLFRKDLLTCPRHW